MEQIDVSSNNIENIPDFTALQKLEVLYLSNNQLNNISNLYPLTNLKRLLLNNNNIEDISALQNLINLTTLDLSKNQISNIGPIANLTNLTDLELSDNKINDISNLKELKNLTYLTLTDNEIEDISVLSSFTNLKSVLLNSNKINDISSLEGLTKLTFLALGYNQISNIDALSNLVNIEHLSINKNNIEDISPISGLINITDLDLGNNKITNIEALSNLTNLEELDMKINQITNIEVLSNLKKLNDLKISSNNIEDISPISGLTNLEILYLSSNSKKIDLTKLSGLTNLRSLSLYSNEIVDVSPLSTLTSLTYLNLDSNHIEDISTISHLSDFSIETNTITKTSTVKEVELPPVFLQVQDPNSKIYTTEEFDLVNCTLNQTKDKVILDDGIKEATVTINGGNADETKLTINYQDETAPTLNVTYQPTTLTNGTVTATIHSDERLQELEGWTLGEDGKTLSKVYATNTEETVTVYDLSGNQSQINIVIDNIDKIGPQLEINYSTTISTNKDVIVTIKASEKIQKEEGWTLSEDEMTLTKTFTQNQEETFTVYDLAGNGREIQVKVSNIDKESPKLDISYDVTEKTNGTVTATITSNEEIQEVEGWIITSDRKSLIKDYSENAKETVTVYDLAGNSTNAEIEINNISEENDEPEQPTQNEPDNQEKDQTTAPTPIPQTGQGFIIIGLILIIVFGAIILKIKLNKLKDVK